jgi:hypothetical protein
VVTNKFQMYLQLFIYIRLLSKTRLLNKKFEKNLERLTLEELINYFYIDSMEKYKK